MGSWFVMFFLYVFNNTPNRQTPASTRHGLPLLGKEWPLVGTGRHTAHSVLVCPSPQVITQLLLADTGAMALYCGMVFKVGGRRAASKSAKSMRSRLRG
jgi:hypothetical protein